MEWIGPYRVLGEIARGAAGLVYRARDEALDRDVAIKLLLGHGVSPVDLERFRAEARAAARLRHPGIVAVHTAGVVGGRPYLVLDLVDGPSLDRLVHRAGPLPQRDAARHAANVARALHYAHKHGVIHRDVKPGNVLVAGGEPLLTDFGLAKTTAGAGHLTATGEVLGTPGYMPPEQANGGRTGVTSDVYSLGATLYHLLTGRPPFDGSSVLETLQRVLTEPPAPPSTLRKDLDPELEAIVLKCLAKEPNDRYLDAATAAVELEAWLAGQASTDLIRAERRGRELLLVLAVGLVVAAVLVGWLLVRQIRLEAELAALRAQEPPTPRPPPIALPDPQPDPATAATPAEASARWRAAAQRQRAAQRWREALSSLGKALDAQPGSVPALIERARLWLAIGCAREATADLKRAVALDPRRERLYLELARAQLEDGRIADALELTTDRIEARPSVDLYLLQGEILLEVRQHRLAQVAYDRALKLDPAHVRARLQRGRARILAREPEKARADFAAVLGAHPDHTEALLFLGDLTSDDRKALELYTRGAKGKDRFADACVLNRARALARLGEPAPALEAYQRFLDHARESSQEEGEAQKAAARLSKQLKRDTVEPALLAARACVDGDDPAGAIEVLRKILTKHPRHIRANEMLSTIHWQARRVDESTALLERALEAHRGHTRLTALLVRQLATVRPEQALSVALRAQEEAPEPTILTAQAITLAFALDRRDAAMVCFRRALAINPELGPAYGFRAKVFLQESRWRAAIRNLSLQLRFTPGDEAYLERAEAFTAIDDHAAALHDYDVALSGSPDHPGALLGRADALRALNQRARAVADYKRFLTIAPKSPAAERVRLQLGQWGVK